MFRTELQPLPSRSKIEYKDSIVTLGSCFADSFGRWLEQYKFQVLPNPFGVIFHPMAQFKLLQHSISNQLPEDYTYLQNQDVHYNFDFHSDFSALSRDELELKIRGSINQANQSFQTSDWLILTFGTAIGYFLKANGSMVANCHKVPSTEFDRKMVSSNEIEIAFREFHDKVKASNPGIKIILTVSPVRHLKETFELNSVSKSTLRVASHNISEEFENVFYFPSYELLLDDLRDYRFYTKDMLHPSDMAEDYIWNKFSQTYFSEQTQNTLLKWTQVKKSLDHRPFHSASNSYQQFLKKTLGQLQELKSELSVEKEIKSIEKQINS